MLQFLLLFRRTILNKYAEYVNLKLYSAKIVCESVLVYLPVNRSQ